MSVKIINKNNVPVLNIDGKDTPLVSFFGNYSDVDDKGKKNTCDQIKMSAETASIHIHSVIIRLPWNQAEDSQDYREVDEIINRLVKADKQTKLIVRFHSCQVETFEAGGHDGTDPKKNFGDRYKDELIKSNRETIDHISFASEIWEKDLLINIDKLIRHFQSQAYRDSILAIHPDNCEWFYPITFDCVGDFSKPMLSKWREFTKKKYQSSESLSDSWGKDFSLDNIEIPTLEERCSEEGSSFLDLEKSRRIYDFNQFYNELVADLIIRIGKTIKESSNNKYLSLTFYGYLFEISNNYKYGTQQSGHCALHKVLESEYIDMLAGPISYFERWDAGETGGGYFMCPVDSITKHGKIWIQEDDARTYLKQGGKECRAASNLKDTINIAKKNMANTIIHNSGTWFMDLNGEGWLKDEKIWQEINSINNIYQALFEQSKVEQFNSEVAVIVDEKSIYAMDANHELMQSLVYKNRYFLSRMGVSCGYYLLSDLLKGKVPKAKLYIFLNAVDVSTDERKYIDNSLKKQDSTLLWIYAPGFIDKDKSSCKNIESLTGFEVGQFDNLEIPEIRMLANEKFANMEAKIITYNLDAFIPGQFPVTPEISPLFYIKNDCEVLGTYTASNKGAIGFKKTGTANSFFYGSPLLSTEFLIDLCRFAKVHLYDDTGSGFVFNNKHFLAISSETAGEKTIKLPQMSDVYDLTNNTLLTSQTDCFKIVMDKNETNYYGINFSI